MGKKIPMWQCVFVMIVHGAGHPGRHQPDHAGDPDPGRRRFDVGFLDGWWRGSFHDVLWNQSHRPFHFPVHGLSLVLHRLPGHRLFLVHGRFHGRGPHRRGHGSRFPGLHDRRRGRLRRVFR